MTAEPHIHIHATDLSLIEFGEIRAKWSASGDRILRYYIDLRHDILHLHKDISAPDLDILENKVNALIATWDQKYENYLKKQKQEDKKEEAIERTEEANEQRSELRSILEATLSVDDTIDWDTLKSDKKFSAKPFKEQKPRRIELEVPNLKISPWQYLFFQASKVRASHETKVKLIEGLQQEEDKKYVQALDTWTMERKKWEEGQQRRRVQFEAKRAEENDKIDKLQQAWLEGDTEAIVEHATIVLDLSEHPKIIGKNFDLQYNSEGKVLIVEYEMPDPDHIPTIKTVRYVASTDEFRETNISTKEARDLYDDVCYQICLRSIHEIFEADTPANIDKIVFNGVVDIINKATGHRNTATIMSLMVDRDEFLNLNLSQIQPKACFKSLKGVSAASLAGLAAIAPVMQIDKSDRRFVESQSVDIEEDGSTNLAAMGWEEFEHLVREVFEKEFAARGGEVKVTQASKDGGVDAIAFDPDPISGGKIVIQAKRYTKTVGVSAVRDLYGTILAEGASKGILVTTADYGPDAHKFAAGKPIALLSGSNLLHLLGKHGVRATIDLAAARKQMGLSGG